MASGPAAGLELVDALVAGGSLGDFHPLYAVRGELLSRLGRATDARAEFRRAAAMCSNAAERAVLEAKADAAG
jgi:predicted RNA polymerase sigma factor